MFALLLNNALPSSTDIDVKLSALDKSAEAVQKNNKWNVKEMNIFYVSKSPKEAAEFLPDKLIVKMPLESAQMLCTAHRIHSDEDWCDANGIYKTAYKNHPCTIWARTTSDNYLWLYSHFIALCSEYTRRYGKEHLSYDLLMLNFYYLNYII